LADEVSYLPFSNSIIDEIYPDNSLLHLEASLLAESSAEKLLAESSAEKLSHTKYIQLKKRFDEFSKLRRKDRQVY